MSVETDINEIAIDILLTASPESYKLAVPVPLVYELHGLFTEVVDPDTEVMRLRPWIVIDEEFLH